MRKVCMIYGIGPRKNGVGKKTGKKYDFTEVSIGYDADGFAGVKCETVAIDADIIGDRALAVGDAIELVMHQANFKTYVDAII